MEKRHILAFVLMALVMAIWSIWLAPKPPISETPKPNEIIDPPTEIQRETPSEEKKIEPLIGEIETLEWPRNAPEDRIVKVVTNKYEIDFSETFAVPRKWNLKEFPDRSGVRDNSINLIPEKSYHNLSLNIPEFADAIQWSADRDELKVTEQNPEAKIKFTAQIGADLKVQKQLTFYYDNYYVDCEIKFENISAEPIDNLRYKIRLGAGINADLLPHELKDKNGSRGPKSKSVGVQAYVGHGKPFKSFDDGSDEMSEPVLWTALNNKYFTMALMPDRSLLATYRYEELRNGASKRVEPIGVLAQNEVANLIIPEFSLTASEVKSDLFRFYVGPKDSKILRNIQSPGANPGWGGLDKVIDFGFFWPIVWVMLRLLNAIYGTIGNYGIAIIMLTALTKLISYPMTQKGQKSMKEMQKLQPKIAELREKYKNDAQKLNQATMLLYKEHKVNPMGGCLPVLPQIPIFISLFSLLRNAVELRGAPFLGWITDLTAPDQLYPLPFTIPLLFVQVDAIRILPLLSLLTTWLQQKTNKTMTTSTDPSQQKMMQFLPFIFVVMFYNWASGVLLYWLCSNLFQIGQQYFTTWQDGKSQETS